MKMICPKSEECKRDGGVGEHCDEHEETDACHVAAFYCPACVPVKPKPNTTGEDALPARKDA